MDLYSSTSLECSRVFTKNYSTSFSKAVSMLHPSLRDSIYAIYGFVRVADEIVDTFHEHPKSEMLTDFRKQVFQSIDERISTNPIINSFQLVVNQYKIPNELITAFLDSMAMDLEKQEYNHSEYKRYIYGSAEVVGLMCLKVFCNGNDSLYNDLKEPARSLGEAFQKVNFLRDVKDDYQERGRVYFPGVDFTSFTKDQKRQIEEDIANDLKKALLGIKKLPKEAKLGVYVAYLYFKALLIRIKLMKPKDIMTRRIRVSNFSKFFLLTRARVNVCLGLV